MTKHLLAGVAGIVLMSGVAYADNYPPAPPPSVPLAPPPAVSSPGDNNPPVAVPGSSVTAPSSGGEHREMTIRKEMDESGRAVTEKETHQEGVSGSSETHTKTETNPEAGTVTRTTTTKHE